MVSTECPINTVDEHAARVVAAIVVLLSLVSLWPPAHLLIAVLAADFITRGFIDRRYSPLRWIAKRITRLLGWGVKPVYAPPKRFAARIGATLTVIATLLILAGQPAAAAVVTVMLIVAASLEATIGFCLACWAYPFVFRVRPLVQR